MSNTVIACGIDTGILLEAGTNELEILVLRAGDSLFGVNVAKVREVLTIDRPTRLPQSHAAVEGTVQIRGQVVELVNLVQFLFGVGEISRPRPTDKMVVMEFNQDLIAFRLNGVEQIFRTSWNTVQPMPHIRGHKAPVTGIVLREGRLIQMLDFESIGAHVGMSRHSVPRRHGSVPAASRADLPIVFAEDSPLVSEMLLDTLQQAGSATSRPLSMARPPGTTCSSWLPGAGGRPVAARWRAGERCRDAPHGRPHPYPPHPRESAVGLAAGDHLFVHRLPRQRQEGAAGGRRRPGGQARYADLAQTLGAAAGREISARVGGLAAA